MNTRIDLPAALSAALLVFAAASAHAQNPWTSRTEVDEMQKSSSTATRASVVAEMNRYLADGGALERNSYMELQPTATRDTGVTRSAVNADTQRYVASGHPLERTSADEIQRASSTASRGSVTAEEQRWQAAGEPATAPRTDLHAAVTNNVTR